MWLSAIKDHDALVAAECRQDWTFFAILRQFSRNHFETCREYSQDLILFEYEKNKKHFFLYFFL